mgnify:CR=1 FL=1
MNQFPLSASGVAPRGASDRLAIVLMSTILVSAIFFQKLTIPFGAGDVIFFGFFVLMALAGLGLLSGRLVVVPKRAAVYALAMGIIAALQIINIERASLLSVIMLMLVHFPYILRFRSDALSPRFELQRFQILMLAVAVLGILQFALQFVVSTDFAFFYDTLLLQTGHAPLFNYMNPVSMNSDYFKSNGVFMLEPSFFCQFLSICIMIELTVLQTWKRLPLYILALLVTFSGTGLMILFILIPIYFLQQGRFFILAAAALVVFTAPLWAPLVGLEQLVNRSTEFTNIHSSGFARFISIFWIIRDFLVPDTLRFLVGYGAGTIGTIVPDAVDYESFDPTWGKLLFEYGIIGTLAYFAFFMTVLRSATVTAYLKVALVLMLMLMGGYLIPPVVHSLIIALLAWPAPQPLTTKDIKS